MISSVFVIKKVPILKGYVDMTFWNIIIIKYNDYWNDTEYNNKQIRYLTHLTSKFNVMTFPVIYINLYWKEVFENPALSRKVPRRLSTARIDC